MEEVAFKVLSDSQDVIKVDNFIKHVIDFTNNSEITYEDVKESIFKLILYKCIRIQNKSLEGNYIYKEHNFYEVKKFGSIALWLRTLRN